MPSEKPATQKPRQYPPVYEKAVPIAIALLAVIILIMLIFTLLVGVGVIGGA